jgi:hypothetical protein
VTKAVTFSLKLLVNQNQTVNSKKIIFCTENEDYIVFYYNRMFAMATSQNTDHETDINLHIYI